MVSRPIPHAGCRGTRLQFLPLTRGRLGGGSLATEHSRVGPGLAGLSCLHIPSRSGNPLTGYPWSGGGVKKDQSISEPAPRLMQCASIHVAHLRN
jgi:hypothetical protein